jgi:hypothetical protein
VQLLQSHLPRSVASVLRLLTVRKQGGVLLIRKPPPLPSLLVFVAPFFGTARTQGFARIAVTQRGSLNAGYIFYKRRKNMAYTKPQVLAQNGKQGVFAAGCPSQNSNMSGACKRCERTS